MTTVLTGLDRDRQSVIASELGLSDYQRNKLAVMCITDRQKSVAKFIAGGYDRHQISEVMGISVKTVEYHRLRLGRNIGQPDIVGITKWAVKCGLVKA